jgi:hypothetical protein
MVQKYAYGVIVNNSVTPYAKYLNLGKIGRHDALRATIWRRFIHQNDPNFQYAAV